MKTKLRKPPVKKELRTQALEPYASYVDGIPQPDDLESLNRSYAVHSWVYAAAWAIASNYAQMEYRAFRENAEGDWEEYPKHDWLRILSKPNPYMGGYQLREMTSLSLDLSGNSYWVIEPDQRTGKSKYIWPMPAHLMLAVSSKQKVIDHYLYQVNGQSIRFEYNEVIHLKYANPRDLVYGQGSLSAVKMAVMSDIYAQAYNSHFFKNSGRPDAVLESETNLTPDMRKRVMQAWESWNRGTENRGKTVILEGNLKLHEVNRSMKDMDFVQLRKYSREEILGAFGVPPIAVGILESANMANSEQQVKLFWEHAIMPRARSIQDQLTMRIQQITFDPLTIFESDSTNIDAMQPNYAVLADVATKFSNLGIPLNEIIDKLDLPFDPVDGGDMPGGAMKPQEPAQPPSGSPMPPPTGEPMPMEPSQRPSKAQGGRINPQIKGQLYKAFDVDIRRREEDMKLDVRAFFRGQKRRILLALEENAATLLSGIVEKAAKPLINIDLIIDVEKEEVRMRKSTDSHIAQAYFDFASKTTQRYGSGGIAFNVMNPRVLAFLEAKELKIVREVTETTKQRLSKAVIEGIRETIEEGLKQGDAVKKIAGNINDLYDLVMEGRAETIARTEILSAANRGALDGLKEAGIEQKEWLPPQDDKNAREWHQEMRDVVVPIGEKFVTPLGNPMDSPHDPDAPAEEVINCRCTIIAGAP